MRIENAEQLRDLLRRAEVSASDIERACAVFSGRRTVRWGDLERARARQILTRRPAKGRSRP
jgi:Mg-chelatase subunit ChlI